jgi:lipoate-protein ligase A
MIFLDLPPMHWDETQLLYHALGRLGIEALALTASIEPYICVGFSQGIPVEVDTDYCRQNEIGVFRREIGGGTVFIDKDQLLIQLVLKRDREDVPAGQSNLFRRFLGPVLETYKALGMDAGFRPINDLLVNGRKVSGTGGGEIGDCNVVATNILLDFDFERMAGALRCPSEEFRNAVRRMMEENLTTVKRETGSIPDLPALRRIVRERFEALLGPMEDAPLRYQVESEMERIRVELFHRRWVSDRGAKKAWREVKVRGGCYVAQVPYNGMEVLLEVNEEKITAASVVGAHQREKWLSALVGQAYCEEQVINIIAEMASR